MNKRLAGSPAGFVGCDAALVLLTAAHAGASDVDRARPPGTHPFDQTLTLQRVGFRVTSMNEALANEVTVMPTGLALNAPIVRRV